MTKKWPKTYSYSGPVMCFDTCLEQNYRAETYAVSPNKARNNISYRYKKANNLAPNAKITLPGELIVKENEQPDFSLGY